MDTKQEFESIAVDDRLQNVLNNLSHCKIEFLNRNEECKNLRDINNRLETEIREVRDLEKSHCQHLDISQQMIHNLQETVSQLMYVKRDVKLLKEQISSKEAYIREMEKNQENELQKYNEKMFNIQADYGTQIEELNTNNAIEFQQKQHECDAKVAMVTCDVEELKAKMREMESEKRERINITVLEYEEKLQQQAILKAQLQEQLSRETARSELNINTFKRRLEELEEKVKHSQFQQYLQNIYTSPYGSQLEKPHSTQNRQEFSLNPIKNKPPPAAPSQYKPLKCANSLQIIYNDNKEKGKTTEKKICPNLERGNCLMQMISLINILSRRKRNSPENIPHFCNVENKKKKQQLFIQVGGLVNSLTVQLVPSQNEEHYRSEWEKDPLFSLWLSRAMDDTNATFCKASNFKLDPPPSVLKDHVTIAKHKKV